MMRPLNDGDKKAADVGARRNTRSRRRLVVSRKGRKIEKRQSPPNVNAAQKADKRRRRDEGRRDGARLGQHCARRAARRRQQAKWRCKPKLAHTRASARARLAASTRVDANRRLSIAASVQWSNLSPSARAQPRSARGDYADGNDAKLVSDKNQFSYRKKIYLKQHFAFIAALAKLWLALFLALRASIQPSKPKRSKSLPAVVYANAFSAWRCPLSAGASSLCHVDSQGKRTDA